MTVKRKNFYLITLHGAYTLGYAVPVNTISINTGYGDHHDCFAYLPVQDENVSEYRCAYWEFSDP